MTFLFQGQSGLKGEKGDRVCIFFGLHILCVLNIEVCSCRNGMLTILLDLINKGDTASQNMMRAVARQVCEQLISGKIYFLFTV
jgi:hypothetical protein